MRAIAGASDMAVRKAIASGRIALEADGTIDPRKADLAWGRHSDPAQARPPARPPRGTPRPVPVAAVEAVRVTLRVNGEAAPASGGMTFVQARTANEVIKAQERASGSASSKAISSTGRARRQPCLRWQGASATPGCNGRPAPRR
ncbi:MAG: hypothetical protein ACKOED_04380 [Aestuariivirga sp.]|uniref:hypothetical protein n=1 Tax=Aestuariivirga sp. TaxID=2650926 RepID=UPI0038CF6368